jgi:hypothetical protein
MTCGAAGAGGPRFPQGRPGHPRMTRVFAGVRREWRAGPAYLLLVPQWPAGTAERAALVMRPW